MNQTTIFDQAEKKKLDGIELVYSHANTLWKREAAEQLQRVIASTDSFTSDDILIPLEQRGILTGDTGSRVTRGKIMIHRHHWFIKLGKTDFRWCSKCQKVQII